MSVSRIGFALNLFPRSWQLSHINLGVETPKNARHIARFQKLSRWSGIFVALLGTIVLFGWAFDIDVLKSFLPIWVTMKVNTAIGMSFAGIALSCHHSDHERPRAIVRLLEQSLAVLILSLGIATTLQYGFSLDFGIDELIFPDDPHPVATYAPGRMALNSAIAFILTGISLIYQSCRRYIASQMAAIALFIISFVGFLGYLFCITEFYGIGAFTDMAIHTSVGFLVLSVGLLFSHPDRGLTSVAVSDLAGGAAIRRLIGLTLALPTLTSGLVLVGKRAGWYDAEVAIVLLGAVSAIMLAVSIWWGARTLGAADYQVLHDSLTGLPNRLLFRQRLIEALEVAKAGHHSLAVLFIDLDRFKKINDSLGHDTGDELLQDVAARLLSILPSHAILSRWGGDEFTLLLPDGQELQQCENLAGQIVTVLNEPFEVPPHSCYLGASVGIATYPHAADNAADLLKYADIAMYAAKDAGGSGVQFYRQPLQHSDRNPLVVERELRLALERQEFSLMYQPKLCLKTGNLAGVEALLRWNCQRLGPISPQQFVPLAEATGEIVPIGEWVLRQACEQIRDWMAAGFPPVRVAVNLSGRQLLQTALVETVRQILDDTGIPPACLELEITETIAIQNVELTQEVLEQLRGLGVWLALDDFGTGYSSLAYLKNFPLNVLKIDRAFVREIERESRDWAIASTIVALGRGLGMKVVAEGVETPEQLHLLRDLGCDEIQGYWFMPPQPPEALADIYDRLQACQQYLNSLPQSCALERPTRANLPGVWVRPN